MKQRIYDGETKLREIPLEDLEKIVLKLETSIFGSFKYNDDLSKIKKITDIDFCTQGIMFHLTDEDITLKDMKRMALRHLKELGQDKKEFYEMVKRIEFPIIIQES